MRERHTYGTDGEDEESAREIERDIYKIYRERESEKERDIER